MPIKPPPPQGEQPSQYLPAGPTDPLVFEEFEGINTTTTRPGVDDKECAWLDGFMPLGPKRNLRTMPGIGPNLFSAPSGLTVVFFDFVNIGATPFDLVFLSDGSITAVNTNSSSATQIAPPGTIQNPSQLNIGVSSSGSKFALIVARQTNGYFIWDGTTFFTPGGIAPGIDITNGGSGYTSAPTVTISGGSGSGATATATVSGGTVTSIQIVNPGKGYVEADLPTASPPGTLTISFSGGGGSGATAQITNIMPTAVGGTAIEVYSGRVWIGNGPTITFSSPGSVTDFSAGNGGGNFTSSDSFLRVSFISLKQTNGFLYLIADSSVNYISSVQTSGSPPVTTFTNQNADPEVGSPFPNSVDVFNRNILFANAFGAHVSYGGAVTKISEKLDGVYNTVPNFGNFIPSAAKAIIFGKKCYILLVPIIDPISGQQVNKLFLWNGKLWWAASQDVTLTFIQFQEINSVITAWGTDGIHIFQLFAQPSIAFTKIAQSKLFDAPGGYQFTKAASRLWGMVQYFSAESPNLSISIDNETSSAAHEFNLGPPVLTWANASGTMTWSNSHGTLTWANFTSSTIVVLPPQAVGQVGVLTGLTIETNSADMAIISMMIWDDIVQYRG